MNIKEKCPGWGENYADFGEMERPDRREQDRGCGIISGICWVMTALVLVAAMAARVS